MQKRMILLMQVYLAKKIFFLIYLELQNNFLAEAYKDDDILGDFVKEKEDVEKQEKAEDLDLTLHGWGSWTGPGMVDHKKDR